MTYHGAFRTGFLLLFALLGGLHTASGQGWTWSSFWQDGNPPQPYAADGNYVSGLSAFRDDSVAVVVNYPGVGASFRLEQYQLDWGMRFGNDLAETDGFHHLARGIAYPASDTFVVLEEKLPFAGGDRTVALSFFRVTNPWQPGNGLFLETPVFGGAGVQAFATQLLTAPNGDFIVMGSAHPANAPDNRDIWLARISAQGVLLWANAYAAAGDDRPAGMAPGANGVFHLLKYTPNGGSYSLLNVGADGSLLGNIAIGNGDTPAGMSATADGNLVFTGRTAGGELLLQKIAPNGTNLWRHAFSTPDQTLIPYSLLEDGNSDIVVLCTRTDQISGEQDGFLMKFDPSGTPLWERRIGRPNRPEEMTQLALCPDGGYLLGGKLFNQANHAYVVKTDLNGIIKPGRILGNVFRDNDFDCTNTSGDLPLENRIVRAFRDSLHVFYGTTDSLGNYSIECDTGDYVLSLMLPNTYWEVCANDVPLSVGYLDTVVVDFALQALIDCPYMTVEHGLLRARPCDTTFLYVDYCNTGPAMAVGAYIEVTLDTLLTYLNSTIPPSAINGNVLTFPLGDVDPEECGRIDIEVAMSCDALAGQVVCTEAHIYPDSICEPLDLGWSGAFVEVDAVCEGDSVLFRLKNTGMGTMSVPLEYIVIEDAVLLRSGSFQLAPGGSMDIKTPANGATWRLTAGQEPGAPGFSLPTAAVEGCVEGGGSGSTGFYNQFPGNDGDAFISEQCLLVTNSFDPNDKQAFPTGFGQEHNIFANTDLEYLIRFQNTGTDTAFRVILLDTLSPYLDPATFRPGASSHPYKFSLSENGVLQFTFQPIALPHSSVDEPGSNGFVGFRISQKPNLPVGTRIENRVGIYFDFNLPVITNTVFHTVHEPWLKLVHVNQPAGVPRIQLSAFPNPFAEQVTVRLEGETIRNARLRLSSADGRTVREMPFVENRLTIERGSLPAGMYFFSVEAEGQILGAGRLVAN